MTGIVWGRYESNQDEDRKIYTHFRASRRRKNTLRSEQNEKGNLQK
jgi:hypothetical protein